MLFPISSVWARHRLYCLIYVFFSSHIIGLFAVPWTSWVFSFPVACAPVSLPRMPLPQVSLTRFPQLGLLQCPCACWFWSPLATLSKSACLPAFLSIFCFLSCSACLICNSIWTKTLLLWVRIKLHEMAFCYLGNSSFLIT